jgi:GMP synthase (glutamine-hydrolysing)
VKSHIAVIDPAMRIPELDCFNRMARSSPVPLTYHLPALYGLDSLVRSADGVEGVVILGSGASVNDDLPWQQDLRAWLEPLFARDVPTLGLCYGHQLLAHLTGGEVGFLHPADEAGAHRKELGLRTIRLAADPLWGEAHEVRMLVSHREAVVQTPADAVVVGTSDTCQVEALVWPGRRMWSFQSHPEATPAFARNNGVPLAPEEEPALAGAQAIVDRFLAEAARPPPTPQLAPRVRPDPLARAEAALEAARIARDEATRGKAGIEREARARDELARLKGGSGPSSPDTSETPDPPKPRRL